MRALPVRLAFGCISMMSAVAAVATLPGCQVNSDAARPVPTAHSGVLDLSAYDFTINGPVELVGEWQLYWQRLLAPGATAVAEAPPVSITLPRTWNDVHLQGTPLGATGYATFRLLVRLPPQAEPYRLRVPEIGSAYQLFADEQLIASAGTVAVDSARSRGQWTIRYAKLPARPEVQLTLHISNHRFRAGGAWRAIRLGTQTQMLGDQRYATGIELFLIGAFLVIGINHLTIFAGRPRDRAPLWLGILCIICSLQLLLSGEQLFSQLLPDISYRAHHTILFLAIFGAIPIFALFEYHVFPQIFQRLALQMILGGSAVFMLLALILPTFWLTSMHGIYKAFVLIAELYMILIVILAARAQAAGARYFLIGLLILVPSTIFDVLLLSSAGFRYAYLVSFSFFVFILLQSIMLSGRFTRALAQAELKETAEIKLMQRELEYNRAMSALEQSRLDRLKKIIQPHYLLNTLTALLHWVQKSPARAEGIVRDLAAEFQKVHIFSGLDAVPIARELELCEAHIRIMEIRYDKAIEYQTSGLDPEREIPPLVFHTLVENAFFHQNVSAIQIKGLGPEHFRIIVQGTPRPGQKGLGIGSSYIEARLRTAYGDAWSISDQAGPAEWQTDIRLGPSAHAYKAARAKTESDI